MLYGGGFGRSRMIFFWKVRFRGALILQALSKQLGFSRSNFCALGRKLSRIIFTSQSQDPIGSCLASTGEIAFAQRASGEAVRSEAV